jgi:hypothetical protein
MSRERSTYSASLAGSSAEPHRSLRNANVCSLAFRMTSDGRPYAHFRRALDARSVMQAETAARELGRLRLLDALDYLTLVAAEAPDRYDRAARKWLR